MQSSSNNTTLFSYRYVYMCYATFAIDMGKQLSPILLHSGIGMSKAISKVKLKKATRYLHCPSLSVFGWENLDFYLAYPFGISTWNFYLGFLYRGFSSFYARNPALNMCDLIAK